MTEVEFHTGIADPVGFTCRLLGKAYRSGVRVLVTAPVARLDAIDKALWLAEEREFLPHVRVPAGEAMLRRTPVWLAASVEHAPATGPLGLPTVVINVDAAAPAALEGIERLIEVVGAEAAERDAGRARWRDYVARGLLPQLRSKAG